MTDPLERPLKYIPIKGPGVDWLDRRKERGSLKEITESELRKSLNRSIGRIIAGIKELIARTNGRI